MLRRQNAQSRVDDDTWPPDQLKNYTPLLLIHHKGHHTVEEENALSLILGAGGYECLEQNEISTSTKNLEDILQPFENNDGPSMVLIEGPPGIGKSVLLAEIAHRWSKNLVLKEFKFLFLVHLRDPSIQNADTVKKFLQLFCRRDERAPEVASACSKYFFKNEGKDLIFLFDGLDEFNVNKLKKSLINDILNRKDLAKCGLIVSSRPHASLRLRQNADLRVTIFGFTEKERDEFIQQALEEQPQKSHDLRKYLDSHLTLSGLCSIPFNMVILVYLCKQGISFPKNPTQLYEYFICHTIRHHLRKHGGFIDNAFTDLSNLPENCNKLLKQLSELSLMGMNNNDYLKVIFNMDDIESFCPDLTIVPENINGFGLLKAIEDYGPTREEISVSFIHFSIQEFLAGYCVTHLSPDQETALLQEKFLSSKQHVNMFNYYVTITKGQRPAFKQFLQQSTFMQKVKNFFIHKNTQDDAISISHKFLDDHMKCFHLFRCFHEAGDEAVCQSILDNKKFDNYVLNLKKTPLKAPDLECIAIFLTSFPQKQWNRIDFNGCHMEDDGFKVLHHGLLDSGVTIRVLKLESNDLTHISSNGIATLATKCKVEVLGISDNATIGENHNLFDMMSIPSSPLIRVSMRNIKLSATSAIALFNALAKGNTVRWLYIRFNDINDSVCDTIAAKMQQITSLERLELSNNSISAATAECIVRALKNNYSLQELYLPGFYSLAQRFPIFQLQRNINKTREELGSERLSIIFED